MYSLCVYVPVTINSSKKLACRIGWEKLFFSPKQIIIIYTFKSLPAHKQNFKRLCKQMKF